MFLKAGALSLALLLASRLFGLLRESAQAAAFGVTGLADVAVLMLTLPDWVTGVLASGALAYVLVPAWAGQRRAGVAASERTVARVLMAIGALLALGLVLFREAVVMRLAGGVPPALLPVAMNAIAWSALALPAALLAALWTTRLQHEHDFTGMYGANLVVNVVLIVAILVAAPRVIQGDAMHWLGVGLFCAMGLRLAWLRRRMPPVATEVAELPGEAVKLPAPPVWLWAILSAGLPLALPFVARSVASQAGEGALATFNYAWKLVELPLMLAIQLVATLAFPAIARALAGDEPAATTRAVQSAIALAWTLACAAAAALLVGSPAIAQLLFGWGRMGPQALERVAQWGAIGAWGLLPQALIAVALTVLAATGRMRVAVFAYGIALAVLLAFARWGAADGAVLMGLLNLLLGAVAVAVLRALGPQLREWMPWRAMAIAFANLAVFAGLSLTLPVPEALPLALGLAASAVAALAVIGVTWWGSAELRTALAR
jgi:peptidoglycan biosynthesis protein MviN/MurJ (putative lipid II flippase)